MRVLFVSGELIAGDLAYRLKKEGCDVKLYIEDESRKDCFGGMIEKIDEWESELKWVGKDGLIVFDEVGYGKKQDKLRRDGYNVVGGSDGGDKLELDRDYGHKIFSTCDIKIVPTADFENIDEAIEFVKKNKGKWVVKQDGHMSFLNYVGEMEDSRDVLSILENYKRYDNRIKNINLQQRIDGIEIGVARYFNGNDWAGPIEFNIEHKDLCNGNVGPKTPEMGTVMWYSDDEESKLYKEVLAKLKPFLKHVNFKGDIDINCIVNNDGVFPLEATTRFGTPSTQLQEEIHLSPWKDFLMAIAKGKKYYLKYKKGIGVIITVSIPPFPYRPMDKEFYQKGVDIIFKEDLTSEELESIHFEEVSSKGDGTNQYCIAGSNGAILFVSGFGATVEEARKKAYNIISKIVVPKMFYRTDIGLGFINEDQKKLKEWGWI